MRRMSLVVLLLSACAQKQTDASRAAPLPVGESIRVHGELAGGDKVVEAARKARFVFLGELHDNPRHHELQAQLLAALVGAGKQPALVFEMLEVDQTKDILAQRDPATFGKALRWEERGWPAYGMYEPMVGIALRFHLPIAAGDLGRQALMAAVKQGDTPATLGFVASLPAAARSAIEDNVRVGHCGYADDVQVKVLAGAQELRDAHLAQRMLAAATADGAILVAGGEHANREHGAAFWAATAPGVKSDEVLSIGFVEGERDAKGFDIVWSTPALERPDPCVAFKDKLERMR